MRIYIIEPHCPELLPRIELCKVPCVHLLSSDWLKNNQLLSELTRAQNRDTVTLICALTTMIQVKGSGTSALSETQFKRRTFHVPDLIPLIKYMKRSTLTFESIKYDPSNLSRPMNYIRSSGPHGNFDCGATSFQTPNFSCAEPNA